MPRLTTQERESVMNRHAGHYEELAEEHPGWEIEPGFGLPELRALFQEYRAKQGQIAALEGTTLANQRAQRDGLFGTSSEDLSGAWFVLSLYKKMARSRLPLDNVLRKTTPQMGKVSPHQYDTILGRFVEHWKLVNAKLPGSAPLMIAGKSLADMESIRAQIAGLTTEINETLQTRLGVLRAEREQMFGDVIEEVREPASVIGRLEAYSIEVQSQFAGTPLSKTLPRIFPVQTTLPRFDFNFRASDNNVVLWWTMSKALKTHAAAIYLKEGPFEETRPVPATAPFKVEFSETNPEDEFDEVELRDADGKTIAHGKRDGSLVEP